MLQGLQSDQRPISFDRQSASNGLEADDRKFTSLEARIEVEFTGILFNWNVMEGTFFLKVFCTCLCL